ncbi:MAG: 4-hydroxybenzoyl-CoA reductase subunit beta [Hyphomicrobiales bacterium]|nr:4-hydroxybenzoyl-CoA reductase subunit beta [Hyphomicrobiales bacterium]
MSEPLPEFTLNQPETVDQAVAAIVAQPSSRFVAGGTDLIVNMRRGLVDTDNLIDLTGISELRQLKTSKTGLNIGAGVTLREICADDEIRRNCGAIAQASDAIAGPGHRSMATIGGNLCLDTRCIYYNQSHWWRKANDFCLKYKGDTCHVAPAGKRCRAAFSGDLAPALMVHGAEVELAGPNGRRRISLANLYQEDGADYLELKPGEFIVAVHVPPADAASQVRSAYAKVRIRGAIDFPLAGVAVACCKTPAGAIQVTASLTGTNSRPFLVEGIDPVEPDQDQDAAFAQLEKLVQKQVSPQRTTTTASHYRRLAVSALARRLARNLAAALEMD